MIKVENIVINNQEFKKTTSDTNKIIRKVETNQEYAEAIDLPTQSFTYEETEKDIINLENKKEAE